MGEIDRILEVIDMGLQRSDEVGYGAEAGVRYCVRCQMSPKADGELCAPCRAWLCDESDEDPTERYKPPIYNDDGDQVNCTPRTGTWSADQFLVASTSSVDITMNVPEFHEVALVRLFACPITSLSPRHYREDGTCECSGPVLPGPEIEGDPSADAEEDGEGH